MSKTIGVDPLGPFELIFIRHPFGAFFHLGTAHADDAPSVVRPGTDFLGIPSSQLTGYGEEVRTGYRGKARQFMTNGLLKLNGNQRHSSQLMGVPTLSVG